MSFDVRALSPDRFDHAFLLQQFAAIPERFRPVVGRQYAAKRRPPPGEWRASESQRIANSWLREEIAPRLKLGAVKLADSDAEICAAALQCAADCAGFLAALVVSDRGAVARQITGYMERRGVKPPQCEALAGLIARATDAAWWRRALRKAAGRQVEQVARELGLVHRRAGLYASDETCARHGEQQRRNALALEQTEAINEEGQAYTLADLAALGLANPDVRRADLMVRIRGFEDYARAHGHVGVFVTWTAPSAYHARLSRTGEPNPRYREGVTPREAQAVLTAQWAKARAKLGRRKCFPYGFRVVEPHHDGTPHWHMLLFVRPDHADGLLAVMREYASEPEPEELGTADARRARFDSKAIDWRRGTAAGYIAKYIAKNINGQGAAGSIGADFEGGGDVTETAGRVRAWASCWGIRQFQQIGGPGVTQWRELRRLRDPVAGQGDLFEQARQAADTGEWGAYVTLQGGIEIKRADRPIQTWREVPQVWAGGAWHPMTNRYREEAAPVVKGLICGGVETMTRLHVWELRRKAQGFEVGAAAQPLTPWTRVNNCTGGWDGKRTEGDQESPPGSERRAFAAQGHQNGRPRGGPGGVGDGNGIPNFAT